MGFFDLAIFDLRFSDLRFLIWDIRFFLFEIDEQN